MSRFVEILLHIGLWLAIIAISFLSVITSSFSDFLPYAYRNSLGFLYSVPLFYFFYIILVPKLLAQKRTGSFILFGLLTILISDMLIGLIDTPLRKLAGLESWTEVWWKKLSGGILASFYFSILSIIFRFVIDWFHNQKIRLELIDKNRASELALMKSQINPHFLFNTTSVRLNLNSVL